MPKDETKENSSGPLMLYFGLFMIVFVPIFKTIAHLPPYLGMMLSLALVSLVAEIVSSRQFKLSLRSNEGHSSGHDHGNAHGNSPTLKALAKIEMPSILFFLGILMTVAALESLGMVLALGQNVSAVMPENVFVIILGISSAVIDNVPLVAASIGMFSEPIDDSVWHFIAYAAGTGGSMLIIGSAAGVVAMGMEKISFFWYLKNITWLAAIGYFAGILVYLLFPH
jgi:Na+/H+ antiporter NhaD/arsenite permease-like protein